jgi:hypothetical protein
VEVGVAGGQNIKHILENCPHIVKLYGIDHNKFRFKYICVECRDIEKMKKYMLSVNYLFAEQLTKQDFLFINKI